MAPNIGIGYAVGFSEEAAYGTVESTVDNFIDAEPGSANFKEEAEAILGEELAYRGLPDANVDKGNKQGPGSLNFPLRFGGGWPLLLAQLNGQDPTAAGAGPYTHTFDLGASIASSNNLTKGISVYVDREGMTGSASAKTAAYTGWKPASIEFIFEQNKRARLNAEGIFKQLDSFGARLTPSFSSRSFIISPSSAASPTTFLTYNAVAYVVKAASIKVEQEWDLRRDMHSPLLLAPVPAGRLKLSGSFTCEAPATAASSGGAFYDDYKAKTRRQIVITADGPTPANEKLVLTVTKALIVTSPEPEVAGPGKIETTVEWEAFYDTAVSRMGRLVLTTSDSAAWA